MLDVKTCRKCGIQKSLSDFGANGSQGLHVRCKECLNAQQQKYRKDYPKIYKAAQKRYRDKYKKRISRKNAEYRKNHPDSQRETYYPREYGITIGDYDDMYIEQGGCCAICGTHQSKLNKRLHIDHCHKTDKVRGLLCSSCNTAIGLLKEDSGIIKNVLKYLEDTARSLQ